VTFHLRNAERIARRSLVLERAGGEWKIAHLHASSVALPNPSATPSVAVHR